MSCINLSKVSNKQIRQIKPVPRVLLNLPNLLILLNSYFMKDCIFCKIIAGEIPNYTVYEDEHVLAFLDIHPRAKGHTLVIPKVHAETFLDLNEDLIQYITLGLRRSMERIEHVLHPDGYNVGWNQLEAGGQEVPHLHIHIMPRYLNDGGGNMHSIINKPSNTPVEEIFNLFK